MLQNNSIDTAIEREIARPPIVGVFALALCVSGPSTLIGWNFLCLVKRIIMSFVNDRHKKNDTHNGYAYSLK